MNPAFGEDKLGNYNYQTDLPVRSGKVCPYGKKNWGTMIVFKEDRLKQQFDRMDSRLRAMVFEMEYLIEKEFDKEIVVTSIERTQKEQNEIYRDQIEKGYFVMVDGVKCYSLDRLKPTLSLRQVIPV